MYIFEYIVELKGCSYSIASLAAWHSTRTLPDTSGHSSAGRTRLYQMKHALDQSDSTLLQSIT